MANSIAPYVTLQDTATHLGLLHLLSGINFKITPEAPQNESGHTQMPMMSESIRH